MECIYVPKDKLLTIKISEEIDENTTEKLRRKIDNEITRFLPRKVIFDFSNVSFMDSAGIGMLLGRYKVIKMLGGQLELLNVNKQIEKVFEISGILRIIPLIKDEQENVG
ncbi:MAG: anti-sigma factor antagonist [Clostridia bacterium]